MLEKLKIFFGSIIASVLLFFILLIVSTLFTSVEASITISLLSFPFIFIFLFLHFYKTEIEKKSDIKYIYFSYKNNNQNLKVDNMKYTYSMSKDYIKRKRAIAYNDGLKLLLAIPLILIVPLSSGVPLIAIIIFIFMTMIPIIYGAYRKIKNTYDNMSNYYINIYRDILTIYQKNIQEEFYISDIEKVKIKYKNNIDSIEYLELFIKKNILTNSIKIEGYLDIEILLNNLMYPSKAPSI